MNCHQLRRCLSVTEIQKNAMTVATRRGAAAGRGRELEAAG
jgi:hypothetical protein